MHRHGPGALQPQPPYGQAQYPPNYAPGHAPHPNYGPFHPNQRGPHPSALHPPYQGYHQPTQYMYYPSPYGQPNQLPHQPQAMFGRRPSMSSVPAPMMGHSVELLQNEGVYPKSGRPLLGPVPGEPGQMTSLSTGTFNASSESRDCIPHAKP